MMSKDRFLGIVLTPSAAQSEGLNCVLDKIAATGASAICFGPSVVAEVGKGRGHRQPPLDIDGFERLLDRPLWGKRELWLKGYRCSPVHSELFEGTPYRPGGELPPNGVDADLPHKLIEGAHARGLKAHVQTSPTCPPGIALEDQFRYVDGSLPQQDRRVAWQGCLNNPRVRAYAVGLVRDTVRSYSDADGLFLDWAEYTVYDLRDHFGCTCEHCHRQATKLGYDWPRILTDVRATWDWLHSLGSQDLARASRIASRPSEFLELLMSRPGWIELLRFKADTVVGLYREFRQAMDIEDCAAMELGANGWCPPFNRSSGMDYRRLADICTSVRPKLFTFHWSAMPRWYGQLLKEWNPDLSERHVLDALVDVFQLQDGLSPRSFAQYHIPGPDELHPAQPMTWRVKMDEVVDQVGARAKCYAYAHSYRPLEQWKRMVAVLRDSPVDGMWVQRYGYLSDAKLDVIEHTWH